jgi:hypothetical protein
MTLLGFLVEKEKIVANSKEVFFIIPVYLQSVRVHSVNWLKEVDECLGEGRSLAHFHSQDWVRCPL